MTRVIADVPVSRELIDNVADPKVFMRHLRRQALESMLDGAEARGETVLTVSTRHDELTKAEVKELHPYMNPDTYTVFRWTGETRP